MAGMYNYKWYMAVTYDQWVKSGNWILSSMQKDIKAGTLTKVQWDAIWKRRDGLYQAKIDKAQSQATVVESGSGGSAVLPGYDSNGNKIPPGAEWLNNLGDSFQNAIDKAKDGFGNLADGITGAAGGAKIAVVAAGGLLFLMLIFRRR